MQRHEKLAQLRLSLHNSADDYLRLLAFKSLHAVYLMK